MRGRLRADVDGHLARRVLAPALPALLAEHPRLEVELLPRTSRGELAFAGREAQVERNSE